MGISRASSEEAVDSLNRVKGLEISLLPVKNRFFGPQVTVTGLLTGRDLVGALDDEYRGRTVLVPDVMLREGDGLFLDDMTIAELEETTGAHIIVVEASADGLVQGFWACRWLMGGEAEGDCAGGSTGRSS